MTRARVFARTSYGWMIFVRIVSRAFALAVVSRHISRSGPSSPEPRRQREETRCGFLRATVLPSRRHRHLHEREARPPSKLWRQSPRPRNRVRGIGHAQVRGHARGVAHGDQRGGADDVHQRRDAPAVQGAVAVLRARRARESDTCTDRGRGTPRPRRPPAPACRTRGATRSASQERRVAGGGEEGDAGERRRETPSRAEV